MRYCRKLFLFLLCTVLLLFSAFPVSAEEAADAAVSAPVPSDAVPVSSSATPSDLASTPSDLLPATPTDLPSAVPEPSPAPEAKTSKSGSLLRLHQISSECTDAYLLTMDDYTVLIDCGTNTMQPISANHQNAALFNYLAASGIDHVDVYFVTHWHNDHCYNVNTLLKLYGTKKTVVYGPTKKIYKELRPLATGKYRQMKDGDHFAAGPLDILCIGPEYSEKLTGLVNEESLNFIVTWNGLRILFTGDYVQKSVYARWKKEIKNIDVLSFPHHGLNPIYITAKCYKRMNPRVVLIPGRNGANVRNFAIKKVGIGKDALYLSSSKGHIMITYDGSKLRYATNVRPGQFPKGKRVPEREKTKKKK